MLRNLTCFYAFAVFCLFTCKKTTDPVISTQNINNKAAVIRKSKTDSLIKIACEGTSLTYGEDIAGTDTTGEQPGFVNGPTRAEIQYPLSMALALNNSKVFLSLRGYPGDRTTEGLTRWQDSTSADICIIEYGTDDAYNFVGYASGPVPVNIYKSQLETIALRRIKQGAWVILCVPPYLESGDTRIAAYRSAAMSAAHELSLGYFDIETSVQQVPSPYSDVVHLNSKGYKAWGLNITSVVNVIN